LGAVFLMAARLTADSAGVPARALKEKNAEKPAKTEKMKCFMNMG